tara:strand:- start:484 stop:1308 length:825 start_codon:yes stop_codon:yes gene_type:complete
LSKRTKVGLTSSQRLHFDIYGFVILRQVLTSNEIKELYQSLQLAKSMIEKGSKLPPIYTHRIGKHHILMGNLVQYHRSLLEYAVHPKLIPLVEDIVGGEVRLEETEAIINRRDPENNLPKVNSHRYQPIAFHRGTKHGWGTYIEQGKFHCVFVKTLAYLTDVGRDDGGTTLIPGSHRLTWSEKDVVEAALADENLLYQVEAKAGDILLFAESLIHSTTAIRSENERTILVAGYTPTMFQPWPGNEVDPEFIASLPPEIQPIISGSSSWHWQRNY